jgi:hypothetical protein
VPSVRTLLTGPDGAPTADPSVAVRGDVVELGAGGHVVRCFDDLTWIVDAKFVEGEDGATATRPRGPGPTHAVDRSGCPDR